MKHQVIPVEDLPNRLPTELANCLTVQILIDDKWVDYAAIKTTEDLRNAARMLRTQPDRYRVFGVLPII